MANVSPRSPLRLLLPFLAVVLLSGCASAPRTEKTADAAPQMDPAAPRILLAGADPEQARSLAMGAAATKGWRVAESANNLLVMQRQINPAVAESLIPGSSQGPKPAQIEVRTLFTNRGDGTEVALQADVLTADAKGEVRLPFTDRYRPELERSLASLRRAWEGANWRVAGASPPLPEPAPPAQFDELDTSRGGNLAAPVAAVEPGVSARPTAQPAATPVPAPRPITPAPPSPSPAPVATTGVSSAPAPATPATKNMLALNTPASTGIWAYYAEHYARVRGCRLAGEGAVLLRKTPEYEEHRVYCEGGQTFMVRCNAGVCRGLQ